MNQRYKLTRTIKTLFLFLSVSLSMSAVAAPGWSGDVKVTEIIVWGKNNLNIVTDPMPDPEGCGFATTAYPWYLVNEQELDYDTAYSALLAAKLNGDMVNLYLSGCTSNRPLIGVIHAK